MTYRDYAISKVMGHKNYKPFKPFRAFDVARDSINLDIVYEFTIADDEEIIVEYEGETKQQFYPYSPYIGCGTRQYSMLADRPYDMAVFHAGSGRQALYR